MPSARIRAAMTSGSAWGYAACPGWRAIEEYRAPGRPDALQGIDPSLDGFGRRVVDYA
jgi:hypothetical protein